MKKKCEDLEPSPLPTSSIGDGQNSWFQIEFDWKIIILGYDSELVIGVVLGNIVAEKNQHWFVRSCNIKCEKDNMSREQLVFQLTEVKSYNRWEITCSK